MVQFNFFRREVNLKVVFYGPGLAGKTTSLEVIHKKTPTAHRGELTSIATEQDRTLFFDFMPVDFGTIGGLKVKCRLFCVPGQVFYNSTRKLVLQGADGIVFVADSQKAKLEENRESFKNLEENLSENGLQISELPVVIEWNKRDLPDILSVQQLQTELNPWNFPAYETVAVTGEGIFACMRKLAALMFEATTKQAQQEQEANAGKNIPLPADPKNVNSGTGKPLVFKKFQRLDKTETTALPTEQVSSPQTQQAPDIAAVARELASWEEQAAAAAPGTEITTTATVSASIVAVAAATETREMITDDKALELLKNGSMVSDVRIAMLDLSDQTFEQEVVFQNVTIGHLRAHNTRFLKKVRWENVCIALAEMGGLYKNPEAESTVAAETSAEEQECEKRAPAHFADDFMVVKSQIVRGWDFDLVTFDGAVTFEAVEVVVPQANPLKPPVLALGSAQFRKNFTITNCHMPGMDARSGIFHGNVKIADTTFSGDVFFGMLLTKSGAVFHESVEFKHCTFEKKARFRAIVCHKNLAILECRFQEQAFLAEAQFRGEVTLFKTTFLQDADFHDSVFESWVNMYEIHVQRNSLWIKTKFHGRLIVSKARLGKLQAENAQFLQGASFNGTECQSTDLSYASFLGRVSFYQMRFGEKCNLQKTFFEQKADFREAQFQGNLMLAGIEAENLGITWEQVGDKLASEQQQNFAIAADEYAFLKNIFEKQNRYEDLDEAYYCYKIAERKKIPLNRPANILRRCFGFLTLDLGCGYGTRPFRIMLAAVVMILLFGVLYAFFPKEFVYNGAFQKNVAFTASNAIYFSVSTFTTMGFGDWAPTPESFFRFVVALEAFVGIFAMALFVGAFTRKVMR